MDVRKICMNCMTDTLNEQGVCDTCHTAESNIQTRSNYLPFRTILKGKYLIGKVLGAGGFAITYLGYDLDLEILVAIKEFCPNDIAGRERTNGLDVLPVSKDVAETFREEQEKFIYEAKRLAKFRNKNGVVSVLDYFKENNTAYIVMDYIDGVTLKQYCRMLNAPMKYDELLTLLHPVMLALKDIHESGMIHRDISADNIMITRDRKNAYLIDFGTARETQSESLTGYSKSFYTPWEQTTKSMQQGPWTDVYAMCATIYYCTANKLLPKVSDRLADVDIVTHSQMGISIPAPVESTIMEGLALHPDNRIRSMEELERKLYKEGGWSLNAAVKGANAMAAAPVRGGVSNASKNIASGTSNTALTHKEKEVDDAWAAIKKANETAKEVSTSQSYTTTPKKKKWGIVVSCWLAVIALIIGIIVGVINDQPKRVDAVVMNTPFVKGQTIHIDMLSQYYPSGATNVCFKDEYGNYSTYVTMGVYNQSTSVLFEGWHSFDICYEYNGKLYEREIRMQFITLDYDMFEKNVLSDLGLIQYNDSMLQIYAEEFNAIVMRKYEQNGDLGKSFEETFDYIITKYPGAQECVFVATVYYGQESSVDTLAEKMVNGMTESSRLAVSEGTTTAIGIDIQPIEGNGYFCIIFYK